jgi:membrane protease YdiL (CAAX protease family)
MSPSQKFRIQHLLFILTSIIGLIIGPLIIQNLGYLDSFPVNGFYKILIIYLVMIATTAYVYRTKYLLLIHYCIGFRKSEIKYVLIAIIASFVIWVIDFLFQNYFDPNQIQADAVSWYNNNKGISLLLSFLSVAVLVPIVEEMLVRGIMLKTVNHYMSNFWSAITVSFIFSALHNLEFDTTHILATSIAFIWNTIFSTLFWASLVYIWLVYKTNSLYPSIAAHIFNNSLTFFYYISLV